MRFQDDSSQLLAYLISPKVTYKASPYLNLGMNYSYLPSRSSDSDDFLDQHRWETEINPRWAVNDWLTLTLRNRIEVRWLEGRSGTSERSRHRPEATFRLKGLGPLESAFISNEFFYDFRANQYNQNRLVPVGLKFRVNSHTDFTMYSHADLGAWQRGMASFACAGDTALTEVLKIPQQ